MRLVHLTLHDDGYLAIGCQQDRGGLWLRSGFDVDFFLRAAELSEQIQLDEQSNVYLEGSVRDLINYVERIFEYFDGVGQPSPALRDIRDSLSRCAPVLLDTLSDLQVAWADTRVRELLADEVSSVPDAWDTDARIDRAAIVSQVVQEATHRFLTHRDYAAGQPRRTTILEAALQQPPRRHCRTGDVA